VIRKNRGLSPISCSIVCLRKLQWQGLGWLTEGLRIDYEALQTITGKDIQTLRMVYKHKRVKSFLASLSQELNID
jgi:hypothetical protein